MVSLTDPLPFLLAEPSVRTRESRVLFAISPRGPGPFPLLRSRFARDHGVLLRMHSSCSAGCHPLRCRVYASLHLLKDGRIGLGVGNGHNEERILQVSTSVGAGFPAQLFLARPCGDLIGNSWRDNPDNSFCVQEFSHFGLRHVIATDHSASATLQVQEKGIERCTHG